MAVYIPSGSRRPQRHSFSNANQIVIDHDLGYKPMVQIILEDGTIAEGLVTHNSDNQVSISFQISLSGEVILR